MKLEKLYRHGIFESIVKLEIQIHDPDTNLNKSFEDHFNQTINSFKTNIIKLKEQYLDIITLNNWNSKIIDVKNYLIESNSDKAFEVINEVALIIDQFTKKSINKYDEEDALLKIYEKEKKDIIDLNKLVENKLIDKDNGLTISEKNKLRITTFNERNTIRENSIKERKSIIQSQKLNKNKIIKIEEINNRIKISDNKLKNFHSDLNEKQERSQIYLWFTFFLGIIILIGFYFFIKNIDQDSKLVLTSYVVYFLSLSIILSFYIYYYKLSNSLRKKIFTIKELDIMTKKLDPSKEVFYTEKYLKSILEEEL